VGVPGRCEAAIHSARRYLETLPPDHVFVKLDYSNAFNSLHRWIWIWIWIWIIIAKLHRILRQCGYRCQTCRALWRTEFLTSMLSVILRTIFLVPWFLYGLFPRGPPPTGGSVRSTALLQHNPSVTPVYRSKPQPWLLGRLITRWTGKHCGR